MYADFLGCFDILVGRLVEWIVVYYDLKYARSQSSVRTVQQVRENICYNVSISD